MYSILSTGVQSNNMNGYGRCCGARRGVCSERREAERGFPVSWGGVRLTAAINAEAAAHRGRRAATRPVMLIAGALVTLPSYSLPRLFSPCHIPAVPLFQ